MIRRLANGQILDLSLPLSLLIKLTFPRARGNYWRLFRPLLHLKFQLPMGVELMKQESKQDLKIQNNSLSCTVNRGVRKDGRQWTLEGRFILFLDEKMQR